MVSRTPNRMLNTESTVFGLNISDMIFILIVYSLTNSILMLFRLEVLSIFLATICALILIPVRLNFRRRIIRDFCVLLAIKYLKRGVACVPARFRYFRTQ